jgi:hypothetical protein
MSTLMEKSTVAGSRDSLPPSAETAIVHPKPDGASRGGFFVTKCQAIRFASYAGFFFRDCAIFPGSKMAIVCI